MTKTPLLMGYGITIDMGMLEILRTPSASEEDCGCTAEDICKKFDVRKSSRYQRVDLVDKLISVPSSWNSQCVKYQEHKHMFTCYKKMTGNYFKCRFDAPYMPFPFTTTLDMLPNQSHNFCAYSNHYEDLMSNLESTD